MSFDLSSRLSINPSYISKFKFNMQMTFVIFYDEKYLNIKKIMMIK